MKKQKILKCSDKNKVSGGKDAIYMNENEFLGKWRCYLYEYLHS